MIYKFFCFYFVEKNNSRIFVKVEDRNGYESFEKNRGDFIFHLSVACLCPYNGCDNVVDSACYDVDVCFFRR